MSSSSQRHGSALVGVDKAVADALIATNSGYSPDRVVADAQLNRLFQDALAQFGAIMPPNAANRHLLGMRKRGCLRGLRCTRRTSFRDDDSYRHAAEIAIRHLEKRDNATLDDIICDPERASEFDKIAMCISPGYTSLQYRWAALNLRKSSRLKPEVMAHVVRPVTVSLGSIQELAIDSIPVGQGLYVFYSPDSTLYVGEAQSLRNRLSKHLDHSDNRELARWFWQHGFTNASLEIQELPAATTRKVRRALEAELIRSRRPVFNVARP